MSQVEQMRGFLADVEQLAGSARSGQWPRLGRIEGSDRTDTVFYAVDDDGAFAALHLDPRWWRDLGVSGLPAALREAQRNAHAKLAVARLTFRRLLGRPHRTAAPAFDLRRGLADTTEVSRLLPSWQATTAESYQRMYEFERRRDASAGGAPTVVAGPDGLVRITVDKGLITDVELTGWRLSEDSTDFLTADIAAALREHREAHRG